MRGIGLRGSDQNLAFQVAQSPLNPLRQAEHVGSDPRSLFFGRIKRDVLGRIVETRRANVLRQERDLRFRISSRAISCAGAFNCTVNSGIFIANWRRARSGLVACGH